LTGWKASVSPFGTADAPAQGKILC